MSSYHVQWSRAVATACDRRRVHTGAVGTAARVRVLGAAGLACLAIVGCRMEHEDVDRVAKAFFQSFAQSTPANDRGWGMTGFRVFGPAGAVPITGWGRSTVQQSATPPVYEVT